MLLLFSGCAFLGTAIDVIELIPDDCIERCYKVQKCMEIENGVCIKLREFEECECI